MQADPITIKRFDPSSAEDLTAEDTRLGKAMNSDLSNRLQVGWSARDVFRVMMGLGYRHDDFEPCVDDLTRRIGDLKKRKRGAPTWSEVRAVAGQCGLSMNSPAKLPLPRMESKMQPITPADAFTLLRNQVDAAYIKACAQREEAYTKICAQLDGAHSLFRALEGQPETAPSKPLPVPKSPKSKRIRASRAKKKAAPPAASATPETPKEKA